ncbi:MAG: 4-alpha-glucanotransferase [Geminicoccaceae bacterium]
MGHPRARLGLTLSVAAPSLPAVPAPTDEVFDRLVRLAGVEPEYFDLAGVCHKTSAATRRTLLAAMGIDLDDIDAEIARLEALPADPGPVPRALDPAEAGCGRAWGVTCQVYGLRCDRNEGAGDLEDVARLAERLGAEGADFLGLSPLHALFPETPERCSPYAPSSRRWHNEQYIAVDTAARDLGLPDPTGTDPPRAAPLIDWPNVAARKTAALESLWVGFRARHLAPGSETTVGDEFRRWRAAAGDDLDRFCLFQALAEAAARTAGRAVLSTEWPAAWRSPDSPVVQRFAEEHTDRVAFRAFLQWLFDRQLAAAQARARAAGMRLGLYADLAVGVVPDGADAWADPHALVAGASVGAPPDPLGPLGQNWNVVAPAPAVLAATDAAPLRAVLRAVMRHAGIIRIDHALGLARLFLIPPGGTAADGAYVRYPFGHLLKAVAEESRAAGCVVIGEDLGTVPDGFRERLQATGLLGYRVVWFERRWPDPAFLRPFHYPYQALATLSTHDLPTVRGFLAGQDLLWRERLGHFATAAAAETERATRRRDLDLLVDALRADWLPVEPTDRTAFAVALHRYLARTHACLAAVQLDDLADELDQPNLPGTIDEHPNWRRRQSASYEEILGSEHARRILTAMREERPR